MATANGDNNRPQADVKNLRVFISHRHDDSALANIIASKLLDWGFIRDHVFISDVIPGDDIDKSVMEQLNTCDLLIHVFTYSRGDWVGREIGFAERRENPPRIVTFQIFDEEPSIRKRYRTVPLTEDDTHRFVRALFTENEFFPGYAPVSPIPEGEGHQRQQLEDYIRGQGSDLYQRLNETASQLGKIGLKPINQNEPELNIYISCKEADLAFAEAVKKVFEALSKEWNYFNIRMSPVASPNGDSKGPLDGESQKFLWETHVVIVLFTRALDNWDLCHLEIGTANDPTVPTRTIFLQLLDAPPNITTPEGMPHSVVDTRDQDKVNELIESLVYQPDFFPDFVAVEPTRRATTNAYIERSAKELFDELEALRNKPKKDYELGPYDDESRWSYVHFHLSNEDLEKCREIDEETKIFETLMKSLTVHDANDYGLRHFGYTDVKKAVEDQVTLDEIFRWWKENNRDPNSNMGWANELVEEIWASQVGRGGYELSWKPFRNLNRQSEFYVYPVLTTVRSYHEGSHTYIVTMFIVPIEPFLASAPARAGG